MKPMDGGQSIASSQNQKRYGGIKMKKLEDRKLTICSTQKNGRLNVFQYENSDETMATGMVSLSYLKMILCYNLSMMDTYSL